VPVDKSPSPSEDSDALVALLDGPWLPEQARKRAWHYTDAGGLLGIMQTSRIWASSPQVLNDDSEVLYGVAVVREALESLISSESLPKKYWAYLRRVVDDSWVESIQTSIFIASASRGGDLLNQWRGYANADGFALGFELAGSWGTRSVMGADGFQELHTPIFPGWYGVNYDHKEQIRQARNSLLMAAHQPPGASAIWFKSPREWAAAIPFSRMMLSVAPVTMKHPAFSDEREVRYVGGATDGTVMFRAAGGRVIPYTPVGLLGGTDKTDRDSDEAFPLKSIICGPGCRPGTTDVVRRALSSFGYTNVEVSASTVPYIGK
jgi:hypothetical protein